MIEPIFVPGNEAALPRLHDTSPTSAIEARDRALLWRATTLAIESALRFGSDLPVGAAAAAGEVIVGRHFASDKRLKHHPAHAEFMAIADAEMTKLRSNTPMPDTVVVTLEPCDDCQDFLASTPSIKRVSFGLPRSAAEERGLLKKHRETIFERALRVGLPYEIVQIDDPQLLALGNTILDNTHRDPHTEVVTIDSLGLQRSLSKLSD